jgi:hypothetical protein
MKRFFQREMNEAELIKYNDALKNILSNTKYLLEQLDSIIENYTEVNPFTFPFYLQESGMTKDEKVEYFKKLREKIKKMEDAGTVRIKVATYLHPMSWFYYLNKLFPKNSFFKNRICYGFCSPYSFDRPIMLAEYTFGLDVFDFKNILAHELTHSLMHTKDLNANNSEDALNDAWTLCFLF